MSIFNAADITCPECGHQQEVQLVASVNADRRPDLRIGILDRSFQAHICEVCETALRLPLHLTYLDMARGLWVIAYAADELPQWEKLVVEADAVFADSFGEGAPEAARALAKGVKPRIVFGWPALREKIGSAEMGLSDTVLELTKAAMLRGRSDLRVALDQALRLVSGTAALLTFQVVTEESDSVSATITVPRDLYDGIEHDAAAWASLRGELEASTFVDLRRMMVAGT